MTDTPTPKSTNILWHAGHISADQRSALTHARGTILWLTGLSGCGKSTIATAVEAALIKDGVLAYVLDGDNIRHGLNKNLSFSPEDRTENIRRIGEVAKLFADAGLIAIASFISPYRADRAAVRSLVPPGQFIEIFIDAPLATCESRDPKGLYKKARAAVATGHGLQFTGIDAPYEAPIAPELHLRTDQMNVEECVAAVVEFLRAQGRILL